MFVLCVGQTGMQIEVDDDSLAVSGSPDVCTTPLTSSSAKTLVSHTADGKSGLLTLS